MHEWITDNGQTPHLVVDATVSGVVVPRQYVRDDKIVLNVSYGATSGLLMKNDFITFSARFGGTPFDIQLPVSAVLGVYSRESGQGMLFSEDDPTPEPSPDPLGAATKPSSNADVRKPRLSIVK
jgi:stringent starvation protein B